MKKPFNPHARNPALEGRTFNGPSQRVANAPGGPDAGKLLDNGFTASESILLHESLGLAGFQWFDGKLMILGKKSEMEISMRAGQAESGRWAVMAFPLYDMNAPSAAEICLHFLAEAHGMAHLLDFQYQIGINMESEMLEFLIQLPVQGVTASQLGELIRTFFEALAETILEDLGEILAHLEAQAE